MFGNLLSVMTDPTMDTGEQLLNRRRHTRRYSDHCVCEINGKIYPVLNWSISGVQITADDRLYAIGQNTSFVLKFKVRGGVEDVTHSGTAVRKSSGKVAFEFTPLTRKTRNQFQNIIDDYMASDFADSQV